MLSPLHLPNIRSFQTMHSYTAYKEPHLTFSEEKTFDLI